MHTSVHGVANFSKGVGDDDHGFPLLDDDPRSDTPSEDDGGNDVDINDAPDPSGKVEDDNQDVRPSIEEILVDGDLDRPESSLGSSSTSDEEEFAVSGNLLAENTVHDDEFVAESLGPDDQAKVADKPLHWNLSITETKLAMWLEESKLSRRRFRTLMEIIKTSPDDELKSVPIQKDSLLERYRNSMPKI